MRLVNGQCIVVRAVAGAWTRNAPVPVEVQRPAGTGGTAPTSSPAGQIHTRVGARSDECVRPDGSPSRREEDPGGGGLERRDQARSGTRVPS
jgi:hypothetical protein